MCQKCGIVYVQGVIYPVHMGISAGKFLFLKNPEHAEMGYTPVRERDKTCPGKIRR